MTTAPHSAPRKLLLVSAVALINENRHVLLAQRPEGKSLAGLWEFPGGKTEPGESPEATLIREVDEELGLHISPDNITPLTFASHSYADFDLLMPLYLCRTWQGIPHGREGQNIAWVPLTDLYDYPMPPADLPLIPFLQKFV
ncbi:NTP pyrophosphohydrolase [Acetobacter sp. DmW_043]|nr:8-oxo-dGTP diphosphatase MutT [Acetobacter sp. DmW_043]OUI88449.1 NTP pyrophosphohydrolase [Acetobacter sp. DmW_043]